MEESGRFVSVMITSRYDPTDDDLPRTKSAIQDLLHSEQNRVRDGKLAIETIGSAAGEFGGVGFAARCSP